MILFSVTKTTQQGEGINKMFFFFLTGLHLINVRL